MGRNENERAPEQRSPWRTTLGAGRGVLILGQDDCDCRNLLWIRFKGAYQVEVSILGNGKYFHLKKPDVDLLRESLFNAD